MAPDGNVSTAEADYDPAAFENHPIPAPGELKCPALFDFGITLLNELPSKQLNTKVFDKSILRNYRITTEEANVSVNPLLIARLLLLLTHCADDGSKTEKEIMKVLKTGIYSFKAQLRFHKKQVVVMGKPKNDTIGRCCEALENISTDFPDLITPHSAMRIFFEQRDTTPIREQFQAGIVDIFRKQRHGTDGSKFVRELNFAIDPTGEALCRRINNHMFEATKKTVKTVVRRDLAPDWRCRMMAAGATNDRFFIRSRNSSIVDRYFYDSHLHNDETRTIAKTLVGTTPYRMKDDDNYRIVEFIGKNNKHSLVIIMPKQKALSESFLKDFDANKFTMLYHGLHKACENTVEGNFSIPTMNIVSPTSLRSIFHREKSWWPFSHDPLAMNRAFCPYKAEFAKVIGRKSDTPSRIFALHDLHVGCKFVVRLHKMEPVVTPCKQKHVVEPPKPIVIKNTSAKVVTIHQPDGDISNVIIDLNVSSILSKRDPVKEQQSAPVAPIPPSKEAVVGDAKGTPLAVSQTEVVAAVPSPVSPVRVAAGTDNATGSADGDRVAPPNPRNVSASADAPPAAANAQNGTRSQDSGGNVGAPNQHNASGDARAIANPQHVTHSRETAANNRTIPLPGFHPQVPVNAMSHADTVDSDEEEAAGPSRHKFVLDGHDAQLVPSGDGAVIDKPFFFVVMHRGETSLANFMPRAIGRFTNVEEVYKAADVPSDV